LLANYLKFKAPGITFYSSTKFSLQKELLGCKKIIGQKIHKKKKKKDL